MAEDKKEPKKEVKGEPASKPSKPAMFKAKLVLRTISSRTVRYRLDLEEGEKETSIFGVSHIEFPRTAPSFPKDPDFNMDFLTRDLTTDRKVKEDAFKKQKAFKEYETLHLVITM